MHADYALHERKQLRGEAGPAFSQDKVVSILNANASGLAHDVEFVQQLLQIEQFDSPWLLLILFLNPYFSLSQGGPISERTSHFSIARSVSAVARKRGAGRDQHQARSSHQR